MVRNSIADYLQDFERLGRETAYAERVGYRTVKSSYGEVAGTAYRFARELNARGIKKGDRIVLWGPNSAAWVSAFFGCANRGVIVVPIDDAAAPDFALRIFHQVLARLLVCSREHSQPNTPGIFFEDLHAEVSRHSPAMLERPVFKELYRVAVVRGEGVLLFSDRGDHVLCGRVYEHLAPWLTGDYSSDEIVARLEKENGRISSLLMGIIESAPFQKRRNTGASMEPRGDRPVQKRAGI